jgi:FAD/FMN-containing dehydrogenase
MVCRAGANYSGNDRTQSPWQNWSGDVPFDPKRWRVPTHNPAPVPIPEGPDAVPAGPPFITDDPTALKSLVEAVAKAAEDGDELHVIGSGWAFEDCAKTDGIMVSLANLNWFISDVLDIRNDALTFDWQVRQSTQSARTHLVHVEAGIRILDLCERLDQQGLAMPVLGGSNGQSLAGAFSTSTHGGDWQQPPFPDIVRAVHLVSAGGQEWWIESAGNPITRSDHDNEKLRAVLSCKEINILRSDNVFDAVRVACGRFGVIYAVVLEVRRQFRVVQLITTPNAASVLQALRDGQNTPSIFTPLFRLLNTDPIPAEVPDARGVPYFLQILFNSQRPSDVWVTRRWETTSALADRVPAAYTSKDDLAKAIVAVVNAGILDILGIAGGTGLGVSVTLGTILLGPLGSLIGTALGANFTVQLVNMVVELDEMVLSGQQTFGAVLAAALRAAWKVPGLDLAIPQIQGMVIESQLRGAGVFGGMPRGPHYRITTGSREDSDQNDFRSDSIELVFDATRPEYLDFLDEVLRAGRGFHQAGYVSLRPSLRSNALLSMHNVDGARAMSIEIASAKNLDGNAAWMSYVHQTAVRRGGRPHWGQYNKLDAMDVEMLYRNTLSQWREALMAVSGESVLCSNNFTRQRGLEPKGLVRAITSVKRTRTGTITHICNDAERWSPVKVSDAVRQIQQKIVTYVAVGNDAFVLIKAVSDGRGGFYLRTQADSAAADNLDELPESTR